LTGVDAGTDTGNRDVEMRRRDSRGLRQFIRDAEGIEKRGQAGIKNFIQCEHVDTHGENDIIIVIRATSQNGRFSVESPFIV
jgi:hypothetical protein